MIGINWCGMYFNTVLSLFSLFLFRAPINVLLADLKQNGLSYWENYVNPILAKLFDDIMEIIWVKMWGWIFYWDESAIY